MSFETLQLHFKTLTGHWSFGDKWREDQTIDSADFDALLQKSLPRLKYHWSTPDSWYQRALDLIDQDDSRIVDPTLLGQLTQVLLNLEDLVRL